MSGLPISARPEVVSRAHGKPMICPACGNDIYLGTPHICPEGFVRPADAGTLLTFYCYNSLNQCCRDWMLLGWPQVDGAPKLVDDERGRMHFDCPKCKRELWFDIAHPDAVAMWNEREQGSPQPPALVAGRIRDAVH